MEVLSHFNLREAIRLSPSHSRGLEGAQAQPRPGSTHGGALRTLIRFGPVAG